MIDRNTNKFRGALILKHPKRYDLDKLRLNHIKVVESINLGLNVISFFIVKYVWYNSSD